MFQIDPMSRVPIYEQIIDEVERFIINGILKPGAQMPSVRNLSVELSLNPNTVQKAYSELDSRKIIFSVPGKGCYISENAKDIILQGNREKLSDFKETVKKLIMSGIDKSELHDCIDCLNICDNGDKL